MRHKFLRISAVTSARRRARRTWFSRRNRSPGVARVSVGLVYDCVKPPSAGDTLELVLAAIVEGEAGARHEILDGLRYEYLGGPGVSCHARPDCHAEAADLAVDQLALAGVRSRSYLDTQIAYLRGDLKGAAYCACRPVEGRVEAVAGGVDLDAPPAPQGVAHDRMVLMHQRLPPRVAKRGLLLSRPDDVGEQRRG